MTRPRRALMTARRSLALAILLSALLPAIAAAHPLGNFTINHFAALRIAADRIALDVIIDRAEIPTFQERQRIDTDGNGDGVVSPDEVEGERRSACGVLARDLELSVAGRSLPLQATAAGLSFPPGAGGLATMRLVCEYAAALSQPLRVETTITFEDRSFPERIGWREIVAAGDGTTLFGQDPAVAGTPSVNGVSARLTAYPQDLLSQPLDVRSLTVEATAGGVALAPWLAPDAIPLRAPTSAAGSAAAGSAASGSAAAGGAADGDAPDDGAPVDGGVVGGATMVAAVPGGIGSDLAAIVDTRELTPIVVLGSLLVAIGLGAVHALSPGHGKTIMAAYLVGSRGTARHAVGLGLTVTVSHTLGVFALAAITLLALTILPPERLYPVLGVVSGGLVVAIGGSLLLARLRAIRSRRHGAHDHGSDHENGPDHGPAHGHEHDLGHQHGHAHRHLPPAGVTLSWRNLFVLGLSGGLVPSASALILLLGSIAAGRVAYGIVLVLGFGVGMAAIMTGVGLALVRATQMLERLPSAGRLSRLSGAMQLGTAVLVVALGIVLTRQALVQVL